LATLHSKSSRRIKKAGLTPPLSRIAMSIDLLQMSVPQLRELRARVGAALGSGMPRPKSVGNKRSNGRPKGSKNRVYPKLNSDGKTVDEVLK